MAKSKRPTLYQNMNPEIMAVDVADMLTLIEDTEVKRLVEIIMIEPEVWTRTRHVRLNKSEVGRLMGINTARVEGLLNVLRDKLGFPVLGVLVQPRPLAAPLPVRKQKPRGPKDGTSGPEMVIID